MYMMYPMPAYKLGHDTTAGSKMHLCEHVSSVTQVLHAPACQHQLCAAHKTTAWDKGEPLQYPTGGLLSVDSTNRSHTDAQTDKITQVSMQAAPVAVCIK